MQPTEQRKVYIAEFDLLRGLAAIFMIVNHVAAALVAKPVLEEKLVGSLFFIGSFAPVLFFFVTGLGAGAQSSRSAQSSRWLSVSIKVAILILADLQMQWGRGNSFGLDFLGFIGLSILLLEIIRSQKFPLITCAIGFCIISALRFLVAPLLRAFNLDPQLPIFDWIIGNSISDISYPFSPWMAYPLLGFIIGAFVARHYDWLNKNATKVSLQLCAAALLPIAASLFLGSRSPGTFFRWGSVAIGFYFASFAVIAITMALALLAHHKLPSSIVSLVSLRGVASFAVVPIHYFLIKLLNRFLGETLNSISYSVVTILVIAIAFFLSRQVEAIAQKLAKSEQQKVIWLTLFGVAVALSIIIISVSSNPIAATIVTTMGQISLCLLFLVRSPFQPKLAR